MSADKTPTVLFSCMTSHSVAKTDGYVFLQLQAPGRVRESKSGSIIPLMPEDSSTPPASRPREVPPARVSPQADAPTVCDRCGADMFRMHAVWRCPACGYKTDCCGW